MNKGRSATWLFFVLFGALLLAPVGRAAFRPTAGGVQRSAFLIADPAPRSDLSPFADEPFDYVIILPNSTFAASVKPLQTWKEKLGFSVRVVTVTDIYSLYPDGDNAERIWNFLHDRYPPGRWGIRYVLLVGDIDRIPMRFLYPDGEPEDGGAYGSDYYYANLDVADWDLDNDDRWGEFSDDNLDSHPEILVGRLPFNDSNSITKFSNNVVAYESTVAAWKRQGLLVHGVFDYESLTAKTDTANLAEMMKSEIFEPFGWTTASLYEWDGISPSIYPSNADLNQTDYENRTALNAHGVISLIMHGVVGGGSMASMVWAFDADNDNAWDVGPPLNEDASSITSQEERVATHPTNAVIFLNGCGTAPVIGDDPNFPTSPLRSRYLVTKTRPFLMVKEYLSNGSPAVIGSTAGSNYSHLWAGVDHDSGQTLSYFFFQNLIEKDLAVGDAFFLAQEQFAQRFGFHRGIRVFNFFGDPSLLQPGIENRPGGKDTLIKEGSYNGLAADYDENGDIYVGVVVDHSSGNSSTAHIFRSTDHGEHWLAWTWVDVPAPATTIWSLSLVVGRPIGETPYLNVLYALQDGRVYDTRIDLSNPDNRSTALVANIENHARFLSTARTFGSNLTKMYLYAAWDYESMSSGDYAVVVYRSADNGLTWKRISVWEGLNQPSISAGVSGSLHLAAVVDDDDKHVVALRSLNEGNDWSTPVSLTGRDGALFHTVPVVAASSDPAYPGVWVVYDYHFQDPVWSSSIDLRFAFSPDNGATWQKNRMLAADRGLDEWIPNMAGFRYAPNRWVNVAYNRDRTTASGYDREIIWRFTSGGLPNYWSPRRIVNDFDGAAPTPIAPVVVFSPGSPISGSGVVYGGANKQNVYFSAPWLSASGSPAPEMAESALAMASSPGAADEVQTLEVQSIPGKVNELQIAWQPLTHIPDASSISGLAVGADGALYAAAVMDTPDAGSGGGHLARVFRTENQGESWTPTAAFDNSWSLSSLIRTNANSLLAAGMALNWGSSRTAEAGSPRSPTALGVIYRSTNNGNSWATVSSIPNMAVYRLVQEPNGTLYAGTGWAGKLLTSADDGLNWTTLADFGAGVNVRDILRTSSGRLVVALEKTDGGEIRSTLNPASGWTAAAGLSAALSVNDLLEVDGLLFAAVREATGGKIYRSDLSGLSWTNPDTIVPPANSITRLIRGAQGQIFAGAESGGGSAETTVYRLNLGLHSWTPYHGWMDLAEVVYDLLPTDTGLYVGTGYHYGSLFRLMPEKHRWLHLPVIRR